MVQPVNKTSLIDIQFGDSYSGEKARRLALEIKRLQQKLNEVISSVSSIDDASLLHVVATTEGLGPQHSVSGLSSGMVLKAIESDEAAFGFLNLDDLGNVSTAGADTGDVLQYINGTWQPVRDLGFSSLSDPGEFSLVYWNDITNTIGWASLGSTLTITNDGMLNVVASGVDHGSLSGLDSDDHPQYAAIAQDEEITGTWVFNELVTIANNDGLLIQNQEGLGTAGIELTTFTIDAVDGVGSQIAFWESPDRDFGHRLRNEGDADLTGDLVLYRHDNDLVGVEVFRITRSESQILGADGTAALPMYSFSSDRDLGLYRIGADQLGISATSISGIGTSTGAVAFISENLSATGTAGFSVADETGTVQMRFGYSNTTNRAFMNMSVAQDMTFQQAGTVMWEFKGTGGHWLGRDNIELQVGTGADLRLFHDATNSTIRNDTGNLSVLSGAVEVLRFIQTNPRVHGLNGTAALPTFGWFGDPDNGMYYVGTNSFGFSTAGVERLRFSLDGAIGLSGANYGTATQVLTSNGSAAPPTWEDAAVGGATDLTYTAATRLLESSTGTDVTLPLVSSGDAGLAPASGGGTTNFLRADGTWAAPSGGTGTDLTYTAASRLLESSTGADVTLPLLSSGDAGLAPASGGGTANFLRADGAWAAPPTGSGSANVGTTTVDFGAFPGTSDTSVAVTGQTGILSGSIVTAWISPVATADHSADEHMVEKIRVFAGNIVAATGFTIYAFCDNELTEPVMDARQLLGRYSGTGAAPGRGKQGSQTYSVGGAAPRLYGQYTVSWSWS